MADPAARETYGASWSATLRRGGESELRGWVDAALGWCDAADAIALRSFRREPRVDRKPDRTLVTEADRAIERLLRRAIAESYPQDGIVGEELGQSAGTSGVRWYLDPIDGTHNYVRGVPVFATLVAVQRDGELQAAVASAPALGQRWYGWRGGGAWTVGPGADPPRRIEVSRVSALEDAHLLYSSTTSIEASGRAPGFRALLAAGWRERGFGDFWGHLLVAEGAAEAMIEVDLRPWDVAAPMLLVEEAGGRITDLDGHRSPAGGAYLATNGRLHETIRRALVEAAHEKGDA
jgi:histidinol-phosphatase